jgi:hypothetical protein
VQNINSDYPNSRIVDEAPSGFGHPFELAFAGESEIQVSKTNVKRCLAILKLTILKNRCIEVKY